MCINIQNENELCVTLKTDKNCFTYFLKFGYFILQNYQLAYFYHFCGFFLNDNKKEVNMLVFTSLSPEIKNWV